MRFLGVDLTRIEEAKELRKQGLSPKQIAEKMGIKTGSVYCYLFSSKKRIVKYRQRKREKKIRSMIRRELTSFNLPLKWENETFRMLQDYHKIRATHGRLFVLDIQSILHLLCRRYKVSTPRKLILITYQGSGRQKEVSGYMDVLQILDGVTPAKPIDYIKKFVATEKLPKQETEEAKSLLKKIPFAHLQSRNPRVLAATILYTMHREGNPANKPILTQDYLASYFKITEVALRNNWRQFFKNNDEKA